MVLRNLLFAALMGAIVPAQAQDNPTTPSNAAAQGDSIAQNNPIAQDNPMLGTWENLTNGDLVGLTLTEGEQCTLYLEKVLQKRTIRTCKYEPFLDGFLIFLFNEHGVCGSEADFEFIYEPQAPLVRLIIGGSEVALRKVQSGKEAK
ncbi:MAG: hypothetical protein NVV73_17280 [Cellvibrionaceae bacterium]|nr:hypothetical protein [Cellvibrionaceae bacterium]